MRTPGISRRNGMMHWLVYVAAIGMGGGGLFFSEGAGFAAESPPRTVHLTVQERTELQAAAATLSQHVASLRPGPTPRPWEDVAVCSAAVEWALRENEFPKPESVGQARRALQLGQQRAALLNQRQSPWLQQPGRTIRGYLSAVDESIQPYALTLPEAFGRDPQRKWPLHLVLHGRDDSLSEIKFIAAHEGRPPAPEADWIQLDVYGRGCNAYRWAGETDVFEALADVQRRYRIDDRRIVLHGFSMGGAGAWHLGLHHPSRWCTVGPGAGFVDFHKYQNTSTRLPPYQETTLHIYDAVDYVQNAFNVPVCTYGGELDKQLVASTQMHDAANQLGVPLSLLIGPGVGHKFHPDTLRQFMDFHRARQREGRAPYPGTREIRFTTYTVKYNSCEWITIEEQAIPYAESTLSAKVDDKGEVVRITTKNIAMLRIARDIAETAEIDGVRLSLADAAERLLPDVFFEAVGEGWQSLNYERSLSFHKNRDLRKRHNLQGPIDDALMQPFVCVTGTETPWSPHLSAWADSTRERFTREFGRWMHGRVPTIRDRDLTPEHIQSKNLLLFGDPGSNSVLRQISRQLPFQWERDKLTLQGVAYDARTHAIVCIYPNPLNPRRYVVLNSGHTFHEADFRKSNAWLFPRRGDIALLRIAAEPGGTYQETVLQAALFDSNWRFPPGTSATMPGVR